MLSSKEVVQIFKNKKNYFIKGIVLCCFINILISLLFGIHFLIIDSFIFIKNEWLSFGIYLDYSIAREICILITSLFSIVELLLITIIPYLILIGLYIIIWIHININKANNKNDDSHKQSEHINPIQ